MLQHICNSLYVYQWLIPIDQAKTLSHAADNLVSPHACRMNPEHLHCTSHVSLGPDEPYSEVFLHNVNDKLNCTTFFWSTHKSAVSVSLSPTQQAMFQVPGSYPHISLSKGQTDQWRDLGPFVAQCEMLTDWQPTCDPDVLRSASTGFHRRSLVMLTPVLRSVYVF